MRPESEVNDYGKRGETKERSSQAIQSFVIGRLRVVVIFTTSIYVYTSFSPPVPSLTEGTIVTITITIRHLLNMYKIPK